MISSSLPPLHCLRQVPSLADFSLLQGECYLMAASHCHSRWRWRSETLWLTIARWWPWQSFILVTFVLVWPGLISKWCVTFKVFLWSFSLQSHIYMFSPVETLGFEECMHINSASVWWSSEALFWTRSKLNLVDLEGFDSGSKWFTLNLNWADGLNLMVCVCSERLLKEVHWSWVWTLMWTLLPLAEPSWFYGFWKVGLDSGCLTTPELQGLSVCLSVMKLNWHERSIMVHASWHTWYLQMGFCAVINHVVKVFHQFVPPLLHFHFYISEGWQRHLQEHWTMNLLFCLCFKKLILWVELILSCLCLRWLVWLDDGYEANWYGRDYHMLEWPSWDLHLIKGEIGFSHSVKSPVLVVRPHVLLKGECKA
jgi:hypothetical protein